MTTNRKLKAHIGNLIKIKGQIFWLDLEMWDRIDEHICHLIKVSSLSDKDHISDINVNAHSVSYYASYNKNFVDIHVLIDGSIKEIRISLNNIELIK